MRYDAANPALDALFLSIGDDDSGKSLFMNARPHDGFKALDGDVQQYFKPHANLLNAYGYNVLQGIPDTDATYDYIFILMPKNKIEARYYAARAIQLLKNNGILSCAAGNKEGGKTLKKMLQNFGLNTIQEQTKNKSRVVKGQKTNIDLTAIQQALSEGSVQKFEGDKYISQPGIFGWNKVDKGSEILLQYLPDNLKGTGADFGCGYGYLSVSLLQKNNSIQSLICIDADARAVKACAKNCEAHSKGTKTQFIWDDLTAPEHAPQNLDFIIMNPPFHDGKKTDTTIGQAFIATAHASLKTGGTLYMVANAHLPYEFTLKDRFKTVEKLYEGDGFKVFCAQK